MLLRRWIHPLILLTLLPLGAQADDMPQACNAASYREFDFWLGDWNVSSPDGRLVGHNRVQKSYNGCVLQENWTGVKGGTGSSFNIYDAPRKVWHQTWVDSMGSLLTLEGGVKDGRMVLSGEQVQPDGKKLQNRITWTPQKDGSVRQLWESSSDGGKTWKVVFDGIYRKSN
ncbi:MAG TPA: hypothetical protein VLG68_01240 [Gammaproteobacteria bacterium]|nr:hypothetical protein [Gammaproteobacteria bacterium]